MAELGWRSPMSLVPEGDPPLSPDRLHRQGLGGWSALVHLDDVPNLTAGCRT